MRAGGGGSIVNVSSVVAARGLRNLAAYAASKGGINALTVQLAVELAPDRIRVNAFAPGATNVQRNLDDDPSYRETWAPLIPLGRIASPRTWSGRWCSSPRTRPRMSRASCSTSTAAGPRWARSPEIRRPRGTPAASRPLIPPAPLRRNRDFVLLLSGRLLSTLGSQVTAIAYPLLVLALTHSPAKAGFVGFAGLLPHATLGLFAGVAADRWNRKRLMIAADGVRALAIATLAAMIVVDRVTFWQIAVVAFVEGAGAVVFNTAHAGALRAIVPAAAAARGRGRRSGRGVRR